MSDYIARLEASLRDAAAREYPAHEHIASSPASSGKAARGPGRSGRWRTGRWWRSSLVAVLMVLAGGSTAAAIALLTRGSAPLTGSVPGMMSRLRYDVSLTPDLEAGNVGWCSYPIFSTTAIIGGAGGGTCSPATSPGAPVILAGGEPLTNEQTLLHRHLSRTQRTLSLFWMVVSARVTAVRIDSRQVIASRPDPRLPKDWRAVVAFTSAPASQLQPVPLDRYGHPISVPSASASHVAPSSSGVARARSYTPGSPTATACSLGRVRLTSVTRQWAVAATTTPALGSRVAANTLFSCARSWFSIKGLTDVPSAAVLLNAQDPQRTAAPPPGLRPTGQSGVFSNPSAEILARRVDQGWLVVQSQSLSVGRRLLETLRVRVRQPAVRRP